MPGEVQTREIGGTKYRMEPLGTRKAGHVALRGGKALVDLFKVTDRESLMRVFGDAVKQLSQDDFDFITDALAEMTTIDLRDPNPKNGARPVKLSSEPVFEKQFAAKLEERLEWMWWGLEVNFGSFFGVARALLARAEESPSTPPPEATGSSGDLSSASG